MSAADRGQRATNGETPIVATRPAEGLIAALDPVTRDVGETWVAWGSGDADEADADLLRPAASAPDDRTGDDREAYVLAE